MLEFVDGFVDIRKDPFNGALLHETDLYWANKNEFLKSKIFVDSFGITCVT